MKTKTKLALWGMILLLSFSFAGTKKGEADTDGEKFSPPKTLNNYAARHGLSSAQYQTEVTKFHKAGFKLTYVDGYYVNEKIKFACLWEKGNTATLIARHNLTSQQYQDEVAKNHKNGYRLLHVDGYSDGNKARYAAIWNKQSTNGLRARHGLTGTEYVAEFKKNEQDGYRLVHISGYGIKGKAYYAAIWKKTNSSDYLARHGLTGKQYQETVSKYWKQGYHVAQVDSYDVQNKTYYACIMEKGFGQYSARHGMNPKNYQLEVENHFYQGYVPISVSGHDAGKKAGYAAAFKNVSTWKSRDTKQLDSKIKKVMKDYKLPSVAIGIVKDGKLVYAKGYGFGNKEDKIIASATSQYRLASISKPITAVAIMKLTESRNARRKIKLTDKVFGTGKILGKKYGKKAYSAREKSITVKQLLEHTAGGDKWDNNTTPDDKDKWGDPMAMRTKESFDKLIGRMLDDTNPTHKPGSYWQYSNFGYCVLGRIIAKKTGMSYEEYVKKHILKPCGITDMRIGPLTKKKRAYREVVYYSKDKPYELRTDKMDAHGGWIASPVDMMRFIVRVDGEPSKKDILKKSTVTTMSSKSPNSANYGKGWFISGNNWTHGGVMTGTNAVLKKKDNGISYIFLTNFREGDKPSHRGDLEKALEDGIKAIKFWPNLDLF